MSSSRYIFRIMSRVEQLEQAVRSLKPDELAAFRRWFAEFDGAVWDAQIEADVKAGRLDALAQQALESYERGNVRDL